MTKAGIIDPDVVDTPLPCKIRQQANLFFRAAAAKQYAINVAKIATSAAIDAAM